MPHKDSYKYPLETHPSRKGTCPNCKKQHVFRYFQGQDRTYGICERKNNCGYENHPTAVASTPIIAVKSEPLKVLYPSVEDCAHIINNQSSHFQSFLKAQLQITAEHISKWNCGTKEALTVFVYQNKQGKYLNHVHIEYGNNGKRNKDKFPFSLKANAGEKYSLCLFGEHLLSPDKIICLVESEKTALIASYFYPKFDWLATGGANKLTDEKIPVLYNRQVYYIHDADKAGKDNSTLKKMQSYSINYQTINLFPDRNDGYDLADAIIDGLRPEINPQIEPATTVTEIADAKLSTFAKVEQYLSELFEFRYNEVSNEIEYKNKEDKHFEPLNEANIYRLLRHNHLRFSQSDLTMLFRSNFVSTYNPFKHYFEQLRKWNKDTEPDYIDLLCHYIPTKDPERFKRHLKKMLVRSIACAIDKIYNKQAFIFVHDGQGSGKTTFCRWLCPPSLSNYIAENISTDKDSLIALAENIIINMDELATLNKAEINSLKAMFSRDVIKVRRPYDKKPVTSPRRASFVGSTNKMEFLTDETGSVRWLCFELTDKLNWDYKKDINIDDIWRQAYTLYKTGFKYELTPDEILENELVNKQYQVTTMEMELIAKYYLPATKEKYDVFYTATDFMNALNEKHMNLKLNTNNIGKALKLSGYKQTTERYESGLPKKGYFICFNNNL